MSETTGVQAPAMPELRFRLPGRWWQVPLHDATEARASIRALIERQVGRADDRAQVREDMRRQFFAALETAIGGDGQSMSIALDIVEAVPLSASFTVFLPPIGMTPAVGTSGPAVIDIVAQGLALTPGQSPDTAHRFSTAQSEVLRTHHRQIVPVLSDDGDSGELPTLVAQYWITIPGTKRVILVVFSTVFVELEEVMLGFFDSIVRVTYWEQPNKPQPAIG